MARWRRFAIFLPWKLIMRPRRPAPGFRGGFQSAVVTHERRLGARPVPAARVARAPAAAANHLAADKRRRPREPSQVDCPGNVPAHPGRLPPRRTGPPLPTNVDTPSGKRPSLASRARVQLSSNGCHPRTACITDGCRPASSACQTLSPHHGPSSSGYGFHGGDGVPTTADRPRAGRFRGVVAGSIPAGGLALEFAAAPPPKEVLCLSTPARHSTSVASRTGLAGSG